MNKKSTTVTATMVGFGADEDWEKAYQFFVKGNTWTLEQLLAATNDLVEK